MTNSTWRRLAYSTALAFVFTAVHSQATAQVPENNTQKAADEAQASKHAAEAIQLLFTPGTPVKNKPFSADAVTSTVQILEDGNRIVRRNVTKEFRDGDGRTRHEQTLPIPGQSDPAATRTMISIHDPIAKTDYLLDPVNKTTSVLDGPNALDLGSLSRPNLVAPGTKTVSQSLGSKAIEGLQCSGTRTTVTIPAGQIGNDRPIVTVTETWYSSDIDAVVQSSASDPRFGRTSYALRSIQRGDQSRTLFQSPANFTLQHQEKSAALILP